MDYKDEKFTLAQYTEFLRILYCISYDRFLKLYQNVFDSQYINSYAQEKFNFMQNRGVASLICEWDYETLYKAFRILVIEKSV